MRASGRSFTLMLLLAESLPLVTDETIEVWSAMVRRRWPPPMLDGEDVATFKKNKNGATVLKVIGNCLPQYFPLVSPRLVATAMYTCFERMVASAPLRNSCERLFGLFNFVLAI